MRHYDAVAPELGWYHVPQSYSMGFPGVVITKRQSALQRNATRLGVAGIDKGVHYLLRNQITIGQEKLYLNVRPTFGGAYINFRITLPGPF